MKFSELDEIDDRLFEAQNNLAEGIDVTKWKENIFKIMKIRNIWCDTFNDNLVQTVSIFQDLVTNELFHLQNIHFLSQG